MKNKHSLFLFIPLCLLFVACSPKQENASEEAQTTLLVSVNGETISQSDYELSETWLPDFVRETDATDTLNAFRFGSLLNLLMLAQEAKKQNMMSEAEQSLVIKEAQAKLWLNSLPLSDVDLSDQVIAQELADHPENYLSPERFTVSFALVHTETKRQALVAGYALANGAQMGYNFVDPPELEKSAYYTEGMPLLINLQGHTFDHDFFAFNFTTRFNEKKGETCRLGPFTAKDDLIFTCERAITELNASPLHFALTKDISCDPDWKAFVIPEWRQAAQKLDADDARLHARQKLLDDARQKKWAEVIDSL